MDVSRYTATASSPSSSASEAVKTKTSNGTLAKDRQSSAKISKKRQRTTFSQSQLHVLEEAFARQQYLVGSERLRLAALLNIGVTQVKVWFQNRRIRWRREQRQMILQMHQQSVHAHTSETTSLDHSSSLQQPLADAPEEKPLSSTPSGNQQIVENFLCRE